jgi:hypothetical protein
MDLTNASAIVAGGAGGFGSATVRRLAQMGAKVVIADVSDERGRRLHGRRRHRQGGRRPRAAARVVIIHIGPDWPGGRRPARMLDPDGVDTPWRSRTRHQRVSQLRLRRNQPGRRRDGEERAPRLEPAFFTVCLSEVMTAEEA